MSVKIPSPPNFEIGVERDSGGWTLSINIKDIQEWSYMFHDRRYGVDIFIPDKPTDD